MSPLRSPALRLGAPLAAALLLIGTAQLAQAGACCLSAGVFGVGRLVIWEEAAVGTSFGLTRTRGSWDAHGAWERYGGYSETGGSAELYSIVRLGERFQAYARAPWITTQKRSGDWADFSQGLGDVQAGLRFEPISVGEYVELPAVSLTASVLAPTGARPEDGGSAVATGTSGRGVWVMSLALSIERAVIPWFARLDVGGTLAPLSFRRKDLGAEQSYGPGLQLGLFGGRELVPDKWVLAAGVVQEWEGPYELDGKRVPGSSARSPLVSLATSYQLTPHWMVQASAMANPWIDQLGNNRQGRFGGSIGARYGYF